MEKRDKEKAGEKIKEAAALSYSADQSGAPRIVALGKGEIAEKILEKAKENDIAVYKDEKLAHTLNRLNPGDEIPRELFEIVAQVLVFVSSMDKRFGEKHGFTGEK